MYWTPNLFATLTGTCLKAMPASILVTLALSQFERLLPARIYPHALQILGVRAWIVPVAGSSAIVSSVAHYSNEFSRANKYYTGEGGMLV